MLKLSYTPEIKETAEVSLNYIEQKLVIKFILWFVKMACFMIIISFCIKVYSKTVNLESSLMLIFSFCWFKYRRSINIFFLEKTLNRKKITLLNSNCLITNQKIIYNISNKDKKIVSQYETPWMKVRKIYKNSNGYVIPLTGIKNVGKFIWLPLRSFAGVEEINIFHDLISKTKIRLVGSAKIL